MSHFYASIDKSMRKTIPTARGSKDSGLDAHLRGWNIGVKVTLDHIGGFDVIRIWQTGGTNDATKTRLIDTIKTELEAK